MRLASRSPTYVLILWSGTTFVAAAITALTFYFLSDLGPHATAIFKAYGVEALIAMTAESMIPEAFRLLRRLRDVDLLEHTLPLCDGRSRDGRDRAVEGKRRDLEALESLPCRRA
jgi:hypothetical protein